MRANAIEKHGLAVFLSMALFAAVFPGCATTNVQSLTKFNQGLAAIQVDSKKILLDFNSLVRELELDRAATLNILKESDVAPGLDAESVARWNSASEALSLYAAALEGLAKPSGGSQMEDSLKALGDRIFELGPAKEASAAKAGALNQTIGHIGRLVVDAASKKKAAELAREADPSIRATLLQMADMIGGDISGGGLRTTLWSNWTVKADGLRQAFLVSGADKRRIAAEYAKILDSRLVGDAALSALHKALLNLADLHAAAAQGRTADASEIANFLQQELSFAKTLLETAKKGTKTGGDL